MYLMADIVFWISGNLIFDLRTGTKSDVFLLAYKEQDASTFPLADAQVYLGFVQERTRDVDITWTVEKSSERPTEFVIKGVQRRV